MMQLALRTIGPDDYSVIAEGEPVGRIRLAVERSPPVWVWNVQVHEPGCGNGTAKRFDQAKADFRDEFGRFTATIGSERYARAIDVARAARVPAK